jgi:hypothetical protein
MVKSILAHGSRLLLGMKLGLRPRVHTIPFCFPVCIVVAGHPSSAWQLGGIIVAIDRSRARRRMAFTYWSRRAIEHRQSSQVAIVHHESVDGMLANSFSNHLRSERRSGGSSEARVPRVLDAAMDNGGLSVVSIGSRGLPLKRRSWKFSRDGELWSDAGGRSRTGRGRGTGAGESSTSRQRSVPRRRKRIDGRYIQGVVRVRQAFGSLSAMRQLGSSCGVGIRSQQE